MEIKLNKALKKDVLNSKLSHLLKTFKTKKLGLKTITKEVENVRQEIYAKHDAASPGGNPL